MYLVGKCRGDAHLAPEIGSKISKWNLVLGITSSGLGGLVASSIFIAALNACDHTVYVAAAVVSLMTAILNALATNRPLCSS